MIKKIIYLFVLSLFLLGCTTAKEPKLTPFAKEYEALNGKETSSGKKYTDLKLENTNIIKYANYDEIDAVLKGSGVIYFGFPECPWCRTLVPVLLETAKEAGLKKISYMNIINERDLYKLDENNKAVKESNGTKGYNALVEKLAAHLDDYILETEDGKEVATGTKRIFAPTVVFVTDGKITYVHKGTLDSQTDPYKKLSKDQKEELMGILMNNMNEVLGLSCEEETKC